LATIFYRCFFGNERGQRNRYESIYKKNQRLGVALVNERKDYKTTTTGDPVALAKEMYSKYRSVAGDAYR